MENKHIYHVSGMTCNGCRTNVEKKLNEIPGVQAQVKLETGEAEIQHNSEINLSLLQQKVAELGGHYELHAEKKDADDKQLHAPNRQYIDLNLSTHQPGKYYCPMMCEGDKVYDESGSCPVCGMNLEKIPNNTLKVTFSCPMHPEIQSDKPGNCSICGMDLVANQTTDEEDGVYQDWKRKLIISVIFTLPVFILSMGDMLPGNPLSKIIPPHINGWIQLLLTLPVFFYTGWTFFVRGWNSFRTWNLNMFSLISLGTTAAFIFSAAALIFPALLPTEMLSHHGHAPLYFESVCVIITLVILGQLMEAKAHSKTNSAIKELVKLTPAEAIRVKEGKEEKIAVSDVQKDYILRVRPGDKVPIDGVIIEGNATIDESMITGESIPIEKKIGEYVIGGTINGNHSFLMQTKQVGNETLLAQIIQLVNDASRSQAPIQKLTDKVSRIFVPIVILIAVLTFVGWLFTGLEDRFAYAVTNALAVLIVACPCALGLATPMSVMVSVGKGAKNGVLIKKAAALELLHKADVLLVDKTGTITEGKPRVTSYKGTSQFKDEDILQLAASINKHSSHPLAQAMVDMADEKGQTFIDVNNFHNITGKGVAANAFHMKALLGNEILLKDNDIAIPEGMMTAVEDLQALGNSVSFLAIDGACAGYIAVRDNVKPEAKSSIQHVQHQDIEVIMLTGDNALTARVIAEEVGIKEYKARLLPQDKLAIIKELQDEGRIVAMAGDGINDAPALTQAHVGIAMGSGTDIAIQSADITLLKGELKGVSKALALSHAMMANIKQNLTFAFMYNVIGIPVAAGILYPIFGILMSPMLAALAMSLSSVSVILNSLRLNMKKLE